MNVASGSVRLCSAQIRAAAFILFLSCLCVYTKCNRRFEELLSFTLCNKFQHNHENIIEDKVIYYNLRKRIVVPASI